MSMFTRRNYIWLASVARDILHKHEDHNVSLIGLADFISDLADALESESPDGFDRDLFIKNVYNNPVDYDTISNL